MYQYPIRYWICFRRWSSPHIRTVHPFRPPHIDLQCFQLNQPVWFTTSGRRSFRRTRFTCRLTTATHSHKISSQQTILLRDNKSTKRRWARRVSWRQQLLTTSTRLLSPPISWPRIAFHLVIIIPLSSSSSSNNSSNSSSTKRFYRSSLDSRRPPCSTTIAIHRSISSLIPTLLRAFSHR